MPIDPLITVVAALVAGFSALMLAVLLRLHRIEQLLRTRPAPASHAPTRHAPVSHAPSDSPQSLSQAVAEPIRGMAPPSPCAIVGRSPIRRIDRLVREFSDTVGETAHRIDVAERAVREARELADALMATLIEIAEQESRDRHSSNPGRPKPASVPPSPPSDGDHFREAWDALRDAALKRHQESTRGWYP